MDKAVFEGDAAQRVYQYLRRFIAKNNLDKFTKQKSIEGTVKNFLEIVIRYVKNSINAI